jgi:hypothetical protein
MLMEMLDLHTNNCHVHQNAIAFVFASHSNPASMAPGSLYVAGTVKGNCGCNGAGGGAT